MGRIQSKKELKFYIMADRILAGLPANPSVSERFKNLIWQLFGYYQISTYLYYMRKLSFYENKSNFISKLCYYNYYLRYNKIGQKLGFTIDYNVFGWGLLIPHYGTIVINGETRAGNLCVLHTNTCIGGGGKLIGDALYLATGSQIVKRVTLKNNVTISSHSLVNKSFEDNVLLTGCPAIIKKHNNVPWYELDDYNYRVNEILKLKDLMNIK